MTLAEMTCAMRGYHLMQHWGVGTGTGPGSILWANHTTCGTCGYQEPVQEPHQSPAGGNA